MKTTEFELEGTTYHLCMNGAALFDIYEKYGTAGFVTDHIQGTGKKAFAATCWILWKLAEQGELCRRYLGMDKGLYPSETNFRLMLTPPDVVRARQAIETAVRLGFAREETPEKKEVDLGLLELQKKTEAGSPGAAISRWLHNFLG